VHNPEFEAQRIIDLKNLMPDYDRPHRRYNPLKDEWVLVSPHRTQRPWLGQVEKTPALILPEYDSECYLCPGNSRVGGVRNPVYDSTFVFDNDFPALLPPDDTQPATSDLFRAEPASGISRVVCFSPRHDLTLPELPLADVEQVVRTWIDQTRDLGERDNLAYVQVFENKGEMMGCSNPHPHSQIWATSFVPNEPLREQRAMLEYLTRTGGCLLCDVYAAEQDTGERIVLENDGFIAFVPFWAVWPYELLLISRRHFGALTDLRATEIRNLAELLKQVTIRYDNLFEISFPYSMGFHQSPFDGEPHPEAHFHLHFYPPLLRSATVRKFMVGFEMLAMPQRDLTPESAAERLRELNPLHYRSRPK
jgi:UDPglucose--hexose-1-phosphate uridylyltransferase